MHILLGYGGYIGTTGNYYYTAFSQEHQVTFAGTAWKKTPGFPPNVDVAELASLLKPDLFVYIDSGSMAYFPLGLDKINCPTAGYLIDAYPPETGLSNRFRICLAPFFDYLFVANKGCIDYYSQARNSLPVHWLPLACDPQVQRDMGLERIYDVGFVGATGGQYDERTQALLHLEKRWKMNDFRRPYYGEEMAEVYSQSKIVFNITLGRILNMRIFEVPPCGALLLTKASNNGQADLFEVGKHIDVFETLAELEAKIDYYLTHNKEREEIARAGQQHALAHHTYDHRAEQIIQTVHNSPDLSYKAPVRQWDEAKVAGEYIKIYSMLRLLDASMTEWSHLKNLKQKQIYATLQLGKAVLRRVKHGW